MIPLFNTQFEAYRNNFVPRTAVTTVADRLPIMIDWAWEAAGDDNTIWQTSLGATNSGNQAPGVNAGLDKTVDLSPATSLGGLVTNDGLGGPVTSLWTVVSKPLAGNANYHHADFPDQHGGLHPGRHLCVASDRHRGRNGSPEQLR